MQLELDVRSAGEGPSSSSQSLTVDAQSIEARVSRELGLQLQALQQAAAAALPATSAATEGCVRCDRLGYRLMDRVV